MNLDEFTTTLNEQTVLVTGAGGTVGSEIVRKLMNLHPKQIVCVGRNREKICSIFETSNSKVIVETFDICDKEQVSRVFYKYNPNIVFHLAAEKDIRLTNADPFKCVFVNVMGTLNILQSTKDIGSDSLIFTSSIKANDPTSIMGATKRIGELLVRSAAMQSGKLYYTVRLSNVMESDGGVYSLFCSQIENGGPITITDPDAVRVFVSAKETAELLLDSLQCASDGCILGLAGGDKTKIVDLANSLVDSYNLEEGNEIDITYVGLRNGEKLVEETIAVGDEWGSTAHNKILISVEEFDKSILLNIEEKALELLEIAKSKDRDQLMEAISIMVPGYGKR